MNPSNRLTLGLTLFFLIILYGCSSHAPTQKSWDNLIPKEAPVTYTPQASPSIDSLLDGPYIPFLNDITASSVRLLSDFKIDSTSSSAVQAIYLFPSSANHWKPVWITKEEPGYLDKISQKYTRPYTQNEYMFKGLPVKIMHLPQQKLFAAQLNSWVLLSENSLAIEESIRSYTGRSPSLNVDIDQLSGHKLVLNVPFMDQWIKQLARVTYRPAVTGIFNGTQPVVLDIQNYPDSSTQMLTLNGTMAKETQGTTPLIESISTENASFHLDENIPDQAAAYSLFHLPPSLAPPKNVPHPSNLDSILINNAELYQQIAQTLHSEYAMAMFSESGYLSDGEYFFLRRIEDGENLTNHLENLLDRNLINRQDQVYNINSQVLAKLFASSINTYDEFYLGIVNQAIVLSKRKGLTESVISDTRRNRVIADQKLYQSISTHYQGPLSALTVAEGQPFLKFVEPYLTPDHYVDALLSKFDILAAGFKKESDQQIEVKLSTYKKPETTAPFQEKWTYALSGTEITGEPVLSDIGGSPRKEIIFATRSGRVHALASDGTEIVQANTGTETPVGAPLVYDWYGNGQNIILQAAGNKIYAWNTRGNILPQFPIQLDETISARPRIADVNRDGIPELIVATANRRVHVLDGRGNNIGGWPQKTNAVVSRTPTFEKINDHWSVIAFASNTIHAWLSNGTMRPGFPKFIQATLRGEPVVHNDHIYGNAADGRLYTISENPPISDSLNVHRSTSSSSDDSLKISSVQISEEGLTGTPSMHNLTLKPNREDTLTTDTTAQKPEKETYILTSSSDGSIYFLRPSGAIHQSYSVSQSLDTDASPFLANLEKEQSKDLLVTSRYGRLFAWKLSSGRRSFNLPTQSMQHPLLTDIDQDGNINLIAQSQNSLICWTLLNP